MKTNEKKAGKAATRRQARGILPLPTNLNDWIFRIPFECTPATNDGFEPDERSGMLYNISYVTRSVDTIVPTAQVRTELHTVTSEYEDCVFKGPGSGTTQNFKTQGYVKYSVPTENPIHDLEEFTISLWINSRVFGPNAGQTSELGLAPFIYINGGETEVTDHHGSYCLGLQDTTSTTQLRIKGEFWDADPDIEWNMQTQDVSYPSFTPGTWLHIVQRYKAANSTFDFYCTEADSTTPPAVINTQIQYAGPIDPITGDQPTLGALTFDNINAIFLAAWEDWIVKGNTAASWQQNSYAGMMEDIIFWGRALSQEEVEELYDLYHTPPPPISEK